MRRQEGKPQIRLPKVGENKFFIIIRVEITYILMKWLGKLVTIHEERWNMLIEQTYGTYIHVHFSLWCGDLT